ncbi:MAG: biotin/lipoyl-binding protein [Anaerolineae bacterium]|jgi:acetyl/propionyl-CoA carboxylase alpha subunit
MKYTVTVDGDVFEIEIGPEGRAWVNQEAYEVDLQHVGGNGEYSLLMDHRSYEIDVGDDQDGHQWLTIGGRPYRTRLHRGDGMPGNGRPAGAKVGVEAKRGPLPHVEMRAPLPGLLVELRVDEGDCVDEDQVVAVLESMKMNLELRAPREGVVRDVRSSEGQQVAQDEVLVILGAQSCTT